MTFPCRISAVLALPRKLAWGLFTVCAASSGSISVAQTPPAANVVPLTVHTPHGGFNRLTVSLTVCAPGTQRCATIDDVMIDTGSTGLRLEASAVPSSLVLPPFLSNAGRPLAECLRFLHDDAWGPLHRADLRIGGMLAANLPIQIIDDEFGPTPKGCPPSSTKPTANGTLGLGPHLYDCPGDCMQSASWPGVFERVGAEWRPINASVPVGSRLPNPVTTFPEHGNGVVFDLPASPDAGAKEVRGTLTFGVDPPVDAAILRLDRDGLFTTRYRGVDYPASYIDSGTETTILADASMPPCPEMPWAFCPNPTQQLRATLVGRDGIGAEASFRVGDYRQARDRQADAWDAYAEAAPPRSQSFVWGAPFFFGRRIALVFDDMAVDDLKGPFYAVPRRDLIAPEAR